MFIKIFLTVHLKHSSFWLTADVKPTSNDHMRAVLWQCMFALSICISMGKNTDI